jgi:hypothetical protein
MYSPSVDVVMTFSCELNDGVSICYWYIAAILAGAASDMEATFRGSALRHLRGRASIGRYFDFYDGRRPHSSLDGNTPGQAYFNLQPLRAAA